MWVMTPEGFTSAVAHRTKRDSLIVRSRDKEALEYLCDQAGVSRNEIKTKFPSDYPYRLVIKRSVYEDWMIERIRGMQYDNFKSAAAKVWGNSDKYLGFLHRIWSLGFVLTPEEVQKENDAARPKYKFGKQGATYYSSSSSYTHSTITPPVPAAVTTAAPADEVNHPGISDILEMTAEERAQALALLEDDARAGDTRADEILNEWNAFAFDDVDALLPPVEEDGALVSVHDMTDEQFAKHEAGGI